MGVALACTWRPRAEGERWRALRPGLLRLYDHIGIVVPTDADLEQTRHLADETGFEISATPRPFCQRYEALRGAVACAASHIHCVDGDRLLHWAETRFEELAATVAAVQQSDCVILGRSEQALGTHPRTLRETEAIINAVGSFLLGQPVDLGGGSRGFSRPAAQAVLRYAAQDSFGDAEWPVVAQRCGYMVSVLSVDGLDWETPDHFQAHAAEPQRQRQLAAVYDQDPERWSRRVQTALQSFRKRSPQRNVHWSSSVFARIAFRLVDPADLPVHCFALVPAGESQLRLLALFSRFGIPT